MSESDKRPILKMEDGALFAVNTWGGDRVQIHVLTALHPTKLVARVDLSEAQARVLIAVLNAALDQNAIAAARRPTASG